MVRPEFVKYVRLDRVAARADGRADTDLQIVRRGPELASHYANYVARDTQRRASPPGVCGPDDLPSPVHKSDRNAVGGGNEKVQTRYVANDGVRWKHRVHLVRSVNRAAYDNRPAFLIVLAENRHVASVDKPAQNDPVRRDAQRIEEEPPIGAHFDLVIPDRQAHIEGGKRVAAHAAAARADRMGDPGQRRKAVDLDVRDGGPSTDFLPFGFHSCRQLLHLLTHIV